MKQLLLFMCVSVMCITGFSRPLLNLPTDVQKDRYGGELRIGMFIEPTIIHPLYTTYSKSVMMYTLMFSQLIELDEHFNPMPDLAYAWDISEDKKTYTFYLRKDAFFHDGEKVTAEDVAFTYNAIRDPKNRSPFCTYHTNIKNIEVESPFTIRFDLVEPDQMFICSLDRGIIPSHCFSEKDLLNLVFLNNPIGSGPFKWKGRESNGNIILEAHEQYYEGRPYLDRIVFKPMMHVSQNSTALFREEIDLVNFISYQQFEYANEDPIFRAIAVEDDHYYMLNYDLTDKYLADREIRVAIAHGINYDDIINKVFHGYARKAKGPFNRDVIGRDDLNNEIQYAPQKAVEILERKGFKLKEGEMFRQKDGEYITLMIVTNSHFPKAEDIAKYLVFQLAEIGVKVSYVVYDDSKDLLNEIRKKTHSNVYLGLLPGYLTANKIDPFWIPESDYQWRMSASCNDSDYCLLVKNATLNIQEESKETLRRLNQHVYSNQYVCFLFYASKFHAINKKFLNIHKYFSNWMSQKSIKEFYIDKQ